MTAYRPFLLAALVASACLVACAAHGQRQPAAPSDDMVLVHCFTIPQQQSWGTISIDLAPAAWRVGHIDGPPATEVQPLVLFEFAQRRDRAVNPVRQCGVRQSQGFATLPRPLAEGCDGVHSILMDVRPNCVTSGAKTDTHERSIQPNVVASQANKRLFRKAGDA